MSRRARRSRGGEQGSASTELVLAAPLLLLLLLFVVLAGRLADTQLTVQHAAHQAARAATLARDPATASAEAAATARATLDQCTDLDVAVDTGRFEPGGSVTVTLACRVDNRDLAGLGVPGHQTITVTAVSVVDTWRGTDDQDDAR